MLNSKVLSLFVLIISIFSFSASAEFDCDSLMGDCEYYSCVESQKRCGERGYAIGFGKKYCLKFEDHISEFSKDGRQWIQEVKECLIDNLDQTDETLNCKKFQQSQVKSHLPCYVNSGYCSLGLKDKLKVNKVIYKSLWRPSLIIAGLRVLGSCSKR